MNNAIKLLACLAIYAPLTGCSELSGIAGPTASGPKTDSDWSQGKEQVTKGQELVKKGDELIKSSRENLRKGEQARTEGRQLIESGMQLMGKSLRRTAD